VKTFVAVFTSSALFGVAIWIVYWIVARQEAAGAFLLGVMTVALTFATVYALVAERDARLEGDDPGAELSEWSGDDLGVFTKQTPWPILIAVCVGLGLLAMLWSPLVAFLVLIGFILCLWRLGAESARQH
jgi:hypothetical protein